MLILDCNDACINQGYIVRYTNYCSQLILLLAGIVLLTNASLEHQALTMRKYSRQVASGLGLVLLSAGIACGQTGTRQPASVQPDSSLVREQRRRIAAFDSAVRTVNTDSLFRLWQAMLKAPDIRKAQLAMMCENARLAGAYGKAAFVAIRRMNDTLWKYADRQAVNAMDRRLVGESPSIGHDTCGPPPSRGAPDWLMRWYVPALPQLPPSPDSGSVH